MQFVERWVGKGEKIMSFEYIEFGGIQDIQRGGYYIIGPIGLKFRRDQIYVKTTESLVYGLN